MDAGQLHKVARLLREVALDATADPGETPVSAGDVAIAEDIARHEKASVGEIAAHGARPEPGVPDCRQAA